MGNEHRFIRALSRQPVDRTPVWIMRQAGRYLPEYRAVRKRAKTFLTLCKTPELACQVTLQPIERFPLDAAIIFSDILTIPDAFNLGLTFAEGEGPRFAHPIHSLEDIKNLPTLDPEIELGYVMDAVRMTKQALGGRVPLIGFAGSPWTIACYMIEGGSSKTFSKIKKFLYANPAVLHQLLAHLSKTIIEYLDAQIAAGADVVMLFDTWGGLLSPLDYETFSLQYMREIVQKTKRNHLGQYVPIILFTKNSAPYLQSMANAGCDAIGLDWTIGLDSARLQIGQQVTLQGNLDPAALYAPPDAIRKAVATVLEQFGTGPGHVFNLGHGIYPDIDPDHVAVMIDAVHTLSGHMHKIPK